MCAGGLELATQLGESLGKSGKAQIILVDQKLTHILKPLLYGSVGRTLNPHEEETNYFAHSAAHHYEFVSWDIYRFDREAKQIVVETEYFSKSPSQEEPAHRL